MNKPVKGLWGHANGPWPCHKHCHACKPHKAHQLATLGATQLMGTTGYNRFDLVWPLQCLVRRKSVNFDINNDVSIKLTVNYIKLTHFFGHNPKFVGCAGVDNHNKSYCGLTRMLVGCPSMSSKYLKNYKI